MTKAEQLADAYQKILETSYGFDSGLVISTIAELLRLAPMEVALKNLLEMYVRNANSGDWGNWNPEEDSEVIAARKALGETK